jgi:hypothetical protein
MPASSCAAPSSCARYGIDQLGRLLVQPHRRQHGKRLVVVQFVARPDRLDPAMDAPPAEIESVAGNPAALLGQPAG